MVETKYQTVVNYEIREDIEDDEKNMAQQAVEKYLCGKHVLDESSVLHIEWAYRVKEIEKEFPELKKIHMYVANAWWYCSNCGNICCIEGEKNNGLGRTRIPEDLLCDNCRNGHAKNVRIEEISLKDLPYNEYLQSEHWMKVRESAKRRAGNRCQLCGAKGGELHVHHNCYDNKGEELPEDLIVLCKDCHERFHGKRENRDSDNALEGFLLLAQACYWHKHLATGFIQLGRQIGVDIESYDDVEKFLHQHGRI